ncbi:MAG: hypothetical protein NXI31_14500 [bacterium]|nr:hypothetical protein [bacterium]
MQGPAGLLALLLAAVVGGGVAGVAVFYLSQPEVRPADSGSSDRVRAAGEVGDAVAAGSLHGDASPGIDAATIARLVDRLERLERRVDEFVQQPLRVEIDPEKGAAKIAPEQIAAAMAELEQQKLAAMSDESLMDTAMRSFKAGQMEDAIAQLESLLQRPLAGELRFQARARLATAHSKTGVEGCQRAARMLQQLVDEHGEASSFGRQASMQLVWTQSGSGDRAAALATADRLTRNSTPGSVHHRNSRWAAGIMAAGLGDTARARAEFTTLLAEIENEPDQGKLAGDIRRRLAEL